MVRAPVLMHGRNSPTHHRSEGVFADLPSPFDATRYHSLVVARDRAPAALHITAGIAGGLVMGMRLLGTWLGRVGATVSA